MMEIVRLGGGQREHRTTRGPSGARPVPWRLTLILLATGILPHESLTWVNTRTINVLEKAAPIWRLPNALPISWDLSSAEMIAAH